VIRKLSIADMQLSAQLSHRAARQIRLIAAVKTMADFIFSDRRLKRFTGVLDFPDMEVTLC
jgi:hypothetical protein